MIRGAVNSPAVANAIRNHEDFKTSGSFWGTTSITAHFGRMPQEWTKKFHEALALAQVTYVVNSHSTPIAWVADGQWVIPDVKYSGTTSTQQNVIRRNVEV